MANDFLYYVDPNGDRDVARGKIGQTHPVSNQSLFFYSNRKNDKHIGKINISIRNKKEGPNPNDHDLEKMGTKKIEYVNILNRIENRLSHIECQLDKIKSELDVVTIQVIEDVFVHKSLFSVKIAMEKFRSLFKWSSVNQGTNRG